MGKSHREALQAGGSLECVGCKASPVGVSGDGAHCTFYQEQKEMSSP